MISLDRFESRGTETPLSRRLSVALLAAALAFLALPTSGTAQSPRRVPMPMSPLAGATHALIEGKYDEAIALADKLDARDPAVVALKARATRARGRYQEAETLLRPVAMRAPTSDAALELGLLLDMLGRGEAKAILEKIAPIADSSNDPYEVARGGRAMRALNRFQEANAAYREAAAALPMDPAIQTAWGELFLEAHNSREALRSFQMAMQVDQRWVPALIGAAQTLADENTPQAITLAKRALEINPSSVEAHLFLAEQAIDAEHKDEARQEIDKALATNPSSLEAHSLLAAMAYVADKQTDFEAEVARTLAIAPNYGEVYRNAGDLAARNYRFDEAVALTRRALELDPRDARALTDLGIHLLRTGDEPGARAALEASIEIDPFDDIVRKNLLAMLDTLDKFVTIRDGDLVMRMNKDEAPVLQEYAVSLAHQALDTLSKRYEFTPKGPILIEIFPKHDDFAVRNVGLPGMIGALGACFGRVVTMDSPHARPPGEFQWEATLWHELTHVISLQMSNQRLPRWFSEGLSTFEEKRGRAEWARQMDAEFVTMLNHDGAIKLRDLNAAFQNPKLISIAYYEGGLLIEHIAATYGDAGIRKLLRAYGQGLDTEAAFKAALDTSFEGLQGGFDSALDKMFGDMKKALAVPENADLRMPVEQLRAYAAEHAGSYPVQLTLGTALRKAGQVDDAMQVFERASALLPTARGSDSPHGQMAAIAIQKDDKARAIAELTALVANDFDNIDAARQLATLLTQSKADIATPAGAAKLRPVYERVVAIDPFDAEAHTMLGRMAMQRNESDAAAREFRVVLALNPVDRAAAYTDLAESYFKGGKRAEAKKQTLAALEIAPTYERAQELLLKLVDGGRH
jgi:tetratricopeptide (TPR) repeat protein